jgi:hypothetical protein
MSKSPHASKALEVRQALWSLQKELLSSLKDQYDSENGYESAPTEWFQVLMTSERYAWMRELTSLMADVDIMTELEFLTENHVGVARAEIERMLLAQNEEIFNKYYRNHLVSGVSLMPLHNQLKASVQHLPIVQSNREHALAERKNWHEEHRHQARKKRN